MTEELNKQTKIFIVVALVVLAVIFSVIFFYKPQAPEAKTVEYNYFTFTEVGGLWETSVMVNDQPYQATFRFNPEQVSDVYITGGAELKSQPIYITFDPNQSRDAYKYLALASSELSLSFIRAFNLSLESACTKNETDACVDRPIVTCDDVNKSVIYLDPRPPAQITLSGSCIKLSGEGIDLLKAVDRLLFKWYRIMK